MRFIKCLIVIFICINVSAQVKLPSYNLESGVLASFGSQTPFWLVSNQYGLVTPEKFNSFLKIGFSSKTDSAKKIDYNYGLDLVNRYTNKYDIYLQQCYLRVKLWFTNLQVGNIEEKFGNQSDLSSGGLLWSANARPMPKVTLYVPEYTPVPFTWKYIEFKGGFSHGWFGDDEFTKDVWLHHKYFYLQAGGKLPVHVHYGLHHAAQWGGESVNPEIGKMPSSFSDFILILFAKSGKGSVVSPVDDDYNKIGNHIGSRNFGLDITLKKYAVSAYWQTIFEDGSGKAYRNIADGLWGISIKNNSERSIIKGITLEYLNTTDQSGPSHDSIAGFPRGGGNDDYFNNWKYYGGWSYKDMTIGTPLITSPLIYHGNTSDYIRNNKVTALHVGINGSYKKVDYRFFYTWSQNYGTNHYPTEPFKEQHSFYLQSYINKILPWDMDLRVDLGWDLGEMYGDNFGVMVSLFKFMK
jgi:hypothetical protein